MFDAGVRALVWLTRIFFFCPFDKTVIPFIVY